MGKAKKVRSRTETIARKGLQGASAVTKLMLTATLDVLDGRIPTRTAKMLTDAVSRLLKEVQREGLAVPERLRKLEAEVLAVFDEPAKPKKGA